MYAYLNGINHLKGIELVKEIFMQARDNMMLLGIPVDISLGDATEFNDIDDVNVLYFNNPFTGEVFRKVIHNIEKSLERKQRKVHIVYTNPRCHKTIVEHGIFRLDYQLYIACGDPIANIYITV